jgi:hypothetical protein
MCCGWSWIYLACFNCQPPHFIIYAHLRLSVCICSQSTASDTPFPESHIRACSRL